MNRRAFTIGIAYVFLTSSATVAARAYSDAAFLGAYGTRYLPHFFIALALAFTAATAAYDALAGRVRTLVLDGAITVALGAAAAGAPALARVGGAGVFAAALVLVGLTSVANLAAWNALASTVAGRSARRLLPRAGAAVTAGGVAAGFGSSAFIARFGLVDLPLVTTVVAAAMLACAVAVVRELRRAPVAAGHAAPEAPQPFVVSARTLVAWLAVVAIVESALNQLVEFQFKAVLQHEYGGARLGVMLAGFMGLTNSLLLVLQLLAVPRLLVSRSLPVTSALHPLLVAVALAAGFALPPFPGAAIARAADSVLRAATGRTSQEVSLSALPAAPRQRWKMLLRGALTPLGAAAAGAALLIAPAEAALGRLVLVEIGLAFVLWWSWRVGARAFLVALAAPLGMRAARAGAAPGLDLDALHRLIDRAASADPDEARLARAAIARAGHRADELAPHLAHEDAAVRAALYTMAARHPDPAAAAELRAAVAIEDDDAALAAGFAALRAHGDGSVAARAERFADEPGELGRAARAYLAAEPVAAPERTPEDWGELLADPDGAVREQAARALAHAAVSADAVERALDVELDLLAVYLAARTPPEPLLAAELAARARRSLERAVAVVALGGAAAQVRAAGRRLDAARDAERRRALDVLQEVARGQARFLALAEQAIVEQAAPPSEAALAAALALDPWLADVAAGRAEPLRARLLGLRRAPLFRDVRGETLAALAADVAMRTVDDGAPVVTAGRSAEACFVVAAGALATPAGVRFGPGASVGELALVDEGPAVVSVAAAGATSLLVVPPAAFRRLADGAPELGLGLARVLARWLAYGKA